MKECIKPELKVQWRGMCCLLEYRRMKIGWIIEEKILFGNGKGIHIARIESPEAVYALNLLCPGMERKGEGGGEWQNGQMTGEDITFCNGKGMHIARIEGPAAGYALYLLSLGIKEEEDSMDD